MSKAQVKPAEKIDDYIEGLPEFAQRICRELRRIILHADDTLVEEWKWGPHYSSNGMVCGYGGFKQHVKLTFFNGSGMKDPDGLFNHCVDNEFSRSVKYTDVSQLDEDLITRYVRESVSVNKQGFRREIKDKTVAIPAELDLALRDSASSAKFFNELSYGYKKEFVDWVAAAKRAETRQQRIEKVVEMCSEGRKLNDKYKK